MDFLAYANAQDPGLLQQGGETARLDGREIRGVYESEWIGPKVGQVPTDIQGPTFYVREADIGAAVRGSILTLFSKTYTVVRMKPDGTGMAYLELRQESA
jgi:hypothetical protein